MAGLAEKEVGTSGKAELGKLVGVLFTARTMSHMAHLKTASFAKHKALNEFYDDIVDLTDEIAEVAQGVYGILDIPFVAMIGNINDPIGMLQAQLKQLDKLAMGCENKALENIYQEIQALYYKTIYLLSKLD